MVECQAASCYYNGVGLYWCKRIDYWDVVNEPTADFYFNLNADPSSIFDVYKNHSWYSIIGEDYIELALQFAHEADPDARLFVNENNIIGYLSGIKKNNFIWIIKDLMEKGAPLHGVGIQGHWAYDYPPFNKIGETVQLFSSMGLEVHITELDLSTYSIVRWFLPELIPVHESYHELLEQLQSQGYYDLFHELRAHSNALTAVVFWGLSDPTSWLLTHPDERNDWPLLFDETYTPKKAFWATVDF